VIKEQSDLRLKGRGGTEMSPRLTQLLEEMTPQEQAEVESFATFVIIRRQLRMPQLLTDDISVQELTELVTASGSFDWLDAEGENIYSVEDGEAVRWPSPS
jgi:hypothetical protein